MKRVKILVVDSQASKVGEPLQEMLNMLPNEDRYEVISTEDPRQAPYMLKDIDLAILELDLTREYPAEQYEGLLPEIKGENVGYKLLAHLKKERPYVKVIILASFPACEEQAGDEKDVALDKGADGFISKPFNLRETIEEIEDVLRR
ncbi:MAG: hypothetical protein ACE5I0_08165 [Candidatus Binatia bacterium]